MPKAKVYILGMAPDGAASLLPGARRILDRAEMVFGGKRLLDAFPSLNSEKGIINNNLAEVSDLIRRNLGHKRMVVLASGDPNFYGIASYLVGKLGKDVVEIVPNVSAMQVAFAHIKESWDDAVFVSVHSRPIEDIVETVRSNHKIGIFTDKKHTPAAVAKVLLEHGVDNYRAYVCQDLGTSQERIRATDLNRLTRQRFSPLNILILLREKSATSPRQILGIPDASFHRRRDGLITKQEVRAISLAKMQLNNESVLWDIGSGSGAVAIEASFLAGKGYIYAIEKNDADVAIIRKNVQKFHAPNIEVVHAFAPEYLSELSDPTAVFIGGSGGRLEEILNLAGRRLKPGGRIVLNIVTLENLEAAVNALKTRGFAPEVTLVNIARSTNITRLTRFEALNPVFVVAASRPEGALSHD
jgi:precorrin-6Y C5,15-methyltransferase (decarboxylating)